MSKKDLDSHVEVMDAISTKDNDQIVCIFADIAVCENALNEDGYLLRHINQIL